MIEQDFIFPYLAHAAMEPMNAVFQFADGGVKIWTGSQMPTVDQAVAAQIFGVMPEKVEVVTKYAGGSFGRRAVPVSDYVAEAAMAAKAWGKPDPVKLVWRREDDMKAGYYRPAYLHRVKVGLDADGNILAWRHTIVGQSILSGTPFAALVKNGVDTTSVEGVSDLPYADAEPPRRTPHHAGRRAGAVVAFGRPYPYGLCRGDDDRPHRRRGRAATRLRSGWRR